MAFHLIVTCVAQKKAKQSHSILDPKISVGSLKDVFHQWRSVIDQSELKKTKAIDLYTGGLWGVFLDAWGVVRNKTEKHQLWILSAGYGLINAEDEIVPYNITFQNSGHNIPSVLEKIEYDSSPNSRMKTLQGWWQCLSQKDSFPNNITSLFSTFKKDDYALVVLGKDYLNAVFHDLSTGIQSTQYPKKIAVISNNVNDPVAKKLNSHWLYADKKFINLPDTNSTFINGKIAHHLLFEMFQNKGGVSWWDINKFNRFLNKLSKDLKTPEIIKRSISSDEQVEAYIESNLSQKYIPFSRLHRAYRDSGRACEYKRFRKLYIKVEGRLKQEAREKRPCFPVKHIPRKTKMQFFLPDWDDRVDPLFNFETEEPFLNRDPYEHDVYHYELYGHLNCDGILVSRSVLEENKNKFEKIKRNGIHKYMRLPDNVPVLADCGAFNYIKQEIPPYETSDILKFYQDLGFNYGVSIDHLIVPGILQKTKYYKVENYQEWIEIDQETYKELSQLPQTKILKTLSKNLQQQMFSDCETLLCHTKEIDIDERYRRYNITLKNAEDFIRLHHSGNYTFTPIGAAQGWDPKSYADSVKFYQDIGYEYIALGGLARSTSNEILSVLRGVNKIRNDKTKLHVFGVARLELIEEFLKYGVTSADSSGVLRQAWLSSKNNFHSESGSNYTALRVPLTDRKQSISKAMLLNDISLEKLQALEQKCLKTLCDFDKGKVSVEKALKDLMTYHDIMGGPKTLEEQYRRTLTDQPWKKCKCSVCKKNGIQVAIFRRNNRNRRRGFHNTWVFFNKFKELTDIK